MNNRRFIEESFPVKEVSVLSAKEKNIRHGHISTLHIWWARRPLASSRATSYAALIPPSENIDEWNRKRQFIIDFSKWENSLNPAFIQKAREDILKANNGKPPKILDPFGGGGSIPLEALRLGCETYSCDLNPVAVLIQKCTLEYPQKYGRKTSTVKQASSLFNMHETTNPLLEDVKKWGNWVLKEARKEIGRFYPEEDDGSIPVGYIWARTIPCQNPSCGAEIPLMRQFWLAKKVKKKIALYPCVTNRQDACSTRVEFKIVAQASLPVNNGYDPMPDNFDPDNGTVSRAVATCLCCGSTVDANTTRSLFQDRKSGQRMVAVVLHKPGTSGKTYRVATEKDMEIFTQAEEYLEEKQEKLMFEWGMNPVPDEPLPPAGTLGFRVQRYGMKTWGDLFNSRQNLALIAFAEKVQISHEKMLAEGYDREYAKVVVSYIALVVDGLADHNCVGCQWRGGSEDGGHIFGRQALPMNWDYFEVNLSSGSTGSIQSSIARSLRVVDHLSQFGSASVPFAQDNRDSCPTVTQASATALPYENNFFDAVLTDPPYYDNVPYSYLSDFFYVWLKRSVGDLYPELFSTPLAPKRNEIVAYSDVPDGFEDGKEFFESMLKNSFLEMHRVLKPNGIAVIVYAHKSTEGWETLINSLLDSGLVMTGAWPINTEMQARLRAKESATLASSIYIIARKMKRQSTGFYNDVREELRKHLNRKLERLWEEGVGGTDFFIAAIGSAIEVFGKYEKVMDYEGNVVRADRMLEDVRKIATDYAVHQILHDGFAGEISDLTRFYVLYRWNYGGARVHFDDARKLAQSCSIDLSDEWGRRGYIKKEKEFVRVLGPQDRKTEDIRDTSELIDVLHRVLLFWERSRRDDILDLLRGSGYGESEAFYRVAQAISETLPIESREKKLLDGFLAGRERLKEDLKDGARQGRLFE